MASEGKGQVMANAVADAAAEVAGARSEAEQISMFAVPTSHDNPTLQRLHAEALERHKAGRPAGAQNKSTKEFREYLLKRGKSPLQSLMEWSMHTPQTLAIELGCKPIEAMGMLMKIWAELAPYLHARVQPTDDQGKAVPSFQMFIGGAQAGVGPGAQAPWLYLDGVAEAQENQQVAALPQSPSHAASSHGDDK